MKKPPSTDDTDSQKKASVSRSTRSGRGRDRRGGRGQSPTPDSPTAPTATMTPAALVAATPPGSSTAPTHRTGGHLGHMARKRAEKAKKAKGFNWTVSPDTFAAQARNEILPNIIAGAGESSQMKQLFINLAGSGTDSGQGDGSLIVGNLDQSQHAHTNPTTVIQPLPVHAIGTSTILGLSNYGLIPT